MMFDRLIRIRTYSSINREEWLGALNVSDPTEYRLWATLRESQTIRLAIADNLFQTEVAERHYEIRYSKALATEDVRGMFVTDDTGVNYVVSERREGTFGRRRTLVLKVVQSDKEAALIREWERKQKEKQLQ